MKAKYVYRAKSKNRRIDVVLYQEGEEEPFFRVITKRLVSFEERNVLITDNMYSVETMTLLTELLASFINEPVVRKISNPHLGFPKWETTVINLTKNKEQC
jgi:hypothetical protein